MTRPFTAASPEPVLFVSLKGCPRDFTKLFGTFTNLDKQRVRLVEARSRTLQFCRLADYRGQQVLTPNSQ
jgi:hypothetical protein